MIMGSNISKKSSFYQKYKLKDGGILIFEVGAGQSRQVSGLLNGQGFINTEVHTDLNNIERVVKSQWKK